MSKWLAAPRIPVYLLAAAAIFLTACERPDASPLAAASLIPTAQAVEAPQEAQLAQAEAGVDPAATPQPVQVNLTVIMPTPAAPVQTIPESLQVIVITPTPDPNQVISAAPDEGVSSGVSQDAVSPADDASTPFPEAYYVGWAWTDSLESRPNNRTVVNLNGAQLRDRPSSEGQKIGLVFGLSEVIVAGESYCGYSPVMTHRDNLLSFISPQPQIFRPVSPVSDSPGIPRRAVDEGSTSGWVYLQAVEVLDNTAAAGEFGLTLRQEPCRQGKNLGFVPAWAEMQIVGSQSGDYIPVRVSNLVIQLRDLGPGEVPMEGLELYGPPFTLPTTPTPTPNPN